MTKKTKNIPTLAIERKPPFLKVVLAATLGILIAVGAPVRGAAPIEATGDPATDWQNIQDALNVGGEVTLQNGPNGEIFNLEGVAKSLSITRDVTVKGRDDAAGNKVKIIANNFRMFAGGILGQDAIAIEVDNPGGTVEFNNLDIESNVRCILVVGDIWAQAARDACKDLKVKDCKIVGTHELALCISTFGCVMGTVTLEGNHIVGHWCAGDYAFLMDLVSSSKWEVLSNTLDTSGACVEIPTSKGLRMENNQCEGPIILNATVIQGEIVVKNNTMLQSGHAVWEGNNAFCLRVSHAAGFSGGEISGNTIEMKPSEGVYLSFIVPAICLASYDVLAGAQGLLVQDNTVTGKADFGIALDNGASDNIVRRNNLESFTAIQFGSYGAAQMVINQGHSNLFTRNVMGPLGPDAFGGIVCRGTDNDIIRNDYTGSSIPGLTSSDQPCVILGAASERNLVFESDSLPPGTGCSTEQVLDLPREPTPRGDGGPTTNIVVKHLVDILAEDINPGVGQRVRDALMILD